MRLQSLSGRVGFLAAWASICCIIRVEASSARACSMLRNSLMGVRHSDGERPAFLPNGFFSLACDSSWVVAELMAWRSSKNCLLDWAVCCSWATVAVLWNFPAAKPCRGISNRNPRAAGRAQRRKAPQRPRRRGLVGSKPRASSREREGLAGAASGRRSGDFCRNRRAGSAAASADVLIRERQARSETQPM
jgi:hypothetical protein